MPIYEFRNKKNGKTFEESMSISAKEEYLKNNPNIEQIFSTFNMGDPVKLGITRPPADFQKYVLGKVKEKTSKRLGKAIERRYTIPKEI